MNAKNILLPAIAGTSLMTLFSYIMANLEGKNFKEPELVAHIEKKALPPTAKKLALPAGWVTHYGVGVAWNLLFNFIRQNRNINPAFKSIIALGGLSGLASILVWKLLLKSLPRRSRNYYKKFYSQLFVVHLIFTVTAILTEKVTVKQSR